MGGGLETPLIGIAAGFVGHYLDVTWPSQHEGNRLIPTPQFVHDWFPSSNSASLTGAPPTGPPTATTKTRWGTGQRLGT
jgi:hypothetical protein